MRISDWSSDVCSSDLQRVSFRLPFDPRLELSSGLRLKGVAVTISASDWQETFRIAEERREAGADFPDDARTEGGGVVLFPRRGGHPVRSEEHTSELRSLLRISYAVFCLTKKNKPHTDN